MKKGTVGKKQDTLLMVLMISLGVMLVICNFFKITPGMETTLTEIVTITIAYYGIPLGIMEIILGIAGMLETMIG